MAEEDEKKEDKFDFTAEGEALGYISLAQARLLAMQAARETPGNYGRRFRGVSMVFTVTESGEDEDYYTVVLSFRPESGFTGTPGREQFFISKEGEVALRQILDPLRTKGRWPQLIITAGIVVVIVAVATAASSIFGGGPFGDASWLPSDPTPVPTPTSIPAAVPLPTEVPDDTPSPTGKPSLTADAQFGDTVITILPSSPARVKSANGDIVVDIDVGSVEAPTRMEIRHLSPPEAPPLPPLFRATGKSFNLTADAPLVKPITIMVQVSDAELALAGGDGSNILIQRWRADTWTPLNTTMDFRTSMAATQVGNLSVFALTIRDFGSTGK